MRIRVILTAAPTFLLVIALLATAPSPALAHPMGNFSINHYARITANRDAIELHYLIDMAEIPTFQEIQRTGIAAKEGDPSVIKYLPVEAESLKSGLQLTVSGNPLLLKLVSANAIFPPGAGGLPTMKLGFVYRAEPFDLPSTSPIAIDYRDTNFPDRAGWKEVIATGGDGVAIASSSVPSKDRSAELSNYTTDLLHSPPQVLDAAVNFRSATTGADEVRASVTAPMRMRGNVQGTPRSAFTDLIKSPQHSTLFLLTAALIAAGLGALHALEPGHGKTLVAAYLVGSQSNFRHVLLLGTIVTTSHTAAVYVLGIATLYASQWILPDHLYPWLGLGSGILVAGVGFVMLMRRFDSRYHDGGHSHSHTHSLSQSADPHPDAHEHHVHASIHHEHNWLGEHVHTNEGADTHSHSHDSHDAPQHDDVTIHDSASGVTSMRELFALGVTGGIVPCPAALVVLLSAIAIHRVAFGLFLIVAFSFGLAAVLIFFGLTMVYARRFMSSFRSDSPLISRWLPMASSAVITIVGVSMAVSSLMSAGLLRINL